MAEDEATVFERVGGEAWFADLVARFYRGVAMDPLLRPLYPDDLTDSKAHMTAFLVQYWGGPGTYSEERGHPRLRMRHAPFVITSSERDAWLRHMVDAVRGGGLDDELEAQMIAYFENAATFLINH